MNQGKLEKKRVKVGFEEREGIYTYYWADT